MFTPESCPKTDRRIPTTSALLSPGLKSSLHDASTSLGADATSTPPSVPEFACVAPRCCLASQRGLSGTSDNSAENATEGISAAPNMARQYWAWKILSPNSPATLEPAVGAFCAMSQFDRYASKTPQTIDNW